MQTWSEGDPVITAERPVVPARLVVDEKVAAAPVRLLLGAEKPLVRAALRALLSRETDFEVLGEVGHSDELVPTTRHLCPSVAVLDLKLPGLTGLGGVLSLRRQCPGTQIVILAEATRLNDLRDAVAAGVGGFIPMDASVGALTSAIRRVHGGESVLDPDLVVRSMRLRPCPLSARELSVLSAISSGASVAEVAASLCLSHGTVRNYISAILMKTGARNRVDALRIAHENDWV
jgi:two-component system response regulator DesR